ncbi:hypothetical protein [Candidatus Nitrosarchaeum limnium]|uniref:Uncharacterized protein n=1 Tax=Candidatus Nitrosarchaeum limnium BG20 TaxID=859192 RepID=S2E5V4_9ARCH|nr:hypothetical protein [Candidatus Nitrosarchaeum limnium]EPA06098.1 hypothetical protein BG20_I1783 [Candidatus Nitrosarchaeum limnium BG20]
MNPDLWFVESADFKFSKDKTKDNACEKTILGVNNPPHKHYLKATTTKKVTEAKITVRCEDFGAFGSLEAKAWFTKQIPPRQPNQPVSCGGRSCCRGSNKVTIPLDENKNKIADSAPQDAGGASGKKDNDNTPAGNGTNGDGLSNYEEYRGFFIEGGTVPEQHIRTDITTKDIFIYDQHNLGIGYYAQTNLNVHILRDPALFNGTGSRIINFNRGFASGGIQHGLWLKRGTLNGPRGRAIGGPGLPGCIQSVVIDTRAIALEGIANMQNRVIAHELGHAINIRHHGQGGTHNSCGPNTERNGLQTSGDVTCVLRYTSYARGWCHALPHHRHNTENPALVGTTFCSSSNATGANNSGAGHQNNAGRGNCRGQIRVKDW